MIKSRKFSLFFLLFIYCISVESMAIEYNFNFFCGKGSACNDFKLKFSKILSGAEGLGEVDDRVRGILLEGGYKSLYYEIKDNNFDVHVEFRKRINGISFQSTLELDEGTINSLLNLKKQDFFDVGKVKQASLRIKNYLSDLGYYYAKVNINKEYKENLVNIVFVINPGTPSEVSHVKVETDDQNVKSFILGKLKKRIGSIYNAAKVSIELNSIKEELLGQGYYAMKFESFIKDTNKDSRFFQIVVSVAPGPRLNFGFFGNERFSRPELLEEIKSRMEQFSIAANFKNLSLALEEIYESKGIYNSRFNIYTVDERDKGGSQLKNIFIDFEEGQKIRVQRLSFVGNKLISGKEIKNHFYKNATLLARRDFFDKKYLENYKNFLQKYLYSKGFVFSTVSPPYLNFSKDKKQVNIEYRITEGIQSIIEEIEFSGVTKEIKDKITKRMLNRLNQPLDITSMEDDLETIEKVLKENGYFFSKITNVDPRSIVRYSSDYRRSRIFINVKTDVLAKLDRVRIIGNLNTKGWVIIREIPIKTGELITPEVISKSFERLTGLGLFNSVQITPIKRYFDNKTSVDLLIKVKEREFGLVEIAPGYRTDLGLKFSGGITYNNLHEKNRTVQLKTEVNRRIDLSTLDPGRRDKVGKTLEYQGRIKFLEPYLFKKPMSFSASSALVRRRFFSFDADIWRISSSLGKKFGKYLSTNIKYQYENIEQFDATEEKDNDEFQIGGLVPSISLDFRDNPIIPTKGAMFNLSTEIVKPQFTVKKNKEEINFVKIISRNSFYAPFEGGVLALLVSGGVQKNLANNFVFNSDGSAKFNENGERATAGKIPSIKVFRLNGADSVRGFDEDEINIIDGGEDISEVIVQGSAFFSSIKLEPRFYIGDQMMIAPFLDAGRVFVESYRPLDLRLSAGLSFKLLTPVGSLDFDYGFKLRRGRYPDGRLEKPGKFHVSIGFF